MPAPRNHITARMPNSWSLIASTSLAVCASTACSASTDDESNSFAVGLLLPYTGSSSGTSANFERSAIFAVDRVNASGGVHGKRVRLVAADTHSNVSRSVASARHLIDQGAVVVIGPESADIAAEIGPILQEHAVAFLSPLVGAADDSLVNCSDQWFRLAPSARTLGEALAKQLASDMTATTAILHEAGGYNETFRTAVQMRFTSLGGQVVLDLHLDPTAQSYTETVERVLAAGVESVVLVTSPRTGALVINEFDASTRHPPKWYLSPLLKTDLLVKNVAPSALDGAKGVAPKIGEKGDTQGFRAAFSDRWEGDLPLEGAYFYYDALALVTYALQLTVPSESGQIPPDDFNLAVIQAASTRGVSTTWNEVELGLELLRDDQEINYTGLTGPVLLDKCGVRRLGAYSTWSVEAGRIVNIAGS